MKIAQLALLLGMSTIGNEFHRESTRSVTKSKSDLSKDRSKPKGNLYQFHDGFQCYALNSKNADRKHNNWLKARKEVYGE